MWYYYLQGLKFQPQIYISRELAVQCHSVIQDLAQFTNLRSSLVVGGLPTKTQETDLRSRPEIIVATPGRLIGTFYNNY